MTEKGHQLLQKANFDFNKTESYWFKDTFSPYIYEVTKLNKVFSFEKVLLPYACEETASYFNYKLSFEQTHIMPFKKVNDHKIIPHESKDVLRGCTKGVSTPSLWPT